MPSRSIEEQIGQMLLLGFRGLTIGDDDPIADDLRLGRVGGVVLFDHDVERSSPIRNIASHLQVKSLIADIKQRSLHFPLIAVDQEGGQVVRLKPRHGFPNTVSQRFLGLANDPSLTRSYAESTAATLSDMGFNLNFAPCVDLDIDPQSPAIGHYERSFSIEADLVVRHSRIVLDSMQRQGVIPVLKHFPGHGSAGTDSHLGLVDITDSWSETELIPYRRLIDEGAAPMIMTGHLFNRRLDSEFPATLSHKLISGLLRGDLGYTGVIVSDDLDMKAIRNHYGLERTVELAIKAGIDILMFGNNLVYEPDGPRRVLAIILELIRRGSISEARIENSFHRIQSLFQ